MQDMKHKDHGTQICYANTEVERHERAGWVCVDHPHDNPFEKKVEKPVNKLPKDDLEEMSLEELKDEAKKKGIIVHHMARETSIIKKLRAA